MSPLCEAAEIAADVATASSNTLWTAKRTAFRACAQLRFVELGRETGAEDGFRHISQHGRAGLTSAIDHYLPVDVERLAVLFCGQRQCQGMLTVRSLLRAPAFSSP